MSIRSPFKLGIAAIAASLAVAGTANAAIVDLAGYSFDDSNYATSVAAASGAIEVYDVVSSGVDEDAAVSGSLGDGVRCATDGCSFIISFDTPVVNLAGDDIVIFGVGIGAPEMFDIAYYGSYLRDVQLSDTGHTSEGFKVAGLSIDLSNLGIKLGESVTEIGIIVNTGANPEEFSAIASLNPMQAEAIATPIPAALQLLLSGIAGLGFAARKKKATA